MIYIKVLKAVLVILISIVCSQLINYYLIDEVIVRYVNPSMLITIGIRLIMAILIGCLIIILTYPNIRDKSKVFLHTLSFLYIIGLILATFRSNARSSSMNLMIGKTIISVIKTGNSRLIVTNILVNIIIPMALPIVLYILGVKRILINLVSSLVIFILLEVIQLLSGKGIFDVDDIILTSIGVVIGVGIITLYEHNITKKAN